MEADNRVDEDMINRVKEKENWEKSAKKIIQYIWKVKGSYLFQSPVDPKKYQLEDYFDIVKRPMDFGTIKNKLNNNIYQSCD